MTNYAREISFTQMKKEARGLYAADRERHASISTNNNHTCRECFCCACAEVVLEELAK